jgi:hypothetical protein
MLQESRKPRESVPRESNRTARPDAMPRFETAPRFGARYQNGVYQTHQNGPSKRYQNQNGPPRYVPRAAAQRISEITQAQKYFTSEKPAVPAPTSTKQPGDDLPRRRPQYPCTYCSSKDHIDPECPLHPRNLKKPQPVTTYYAEYDDHDAEEDMVPVDPAIYNV